MRRFAACKPSKLLKVLPQKKPFTLNISAQQKKQCRCPTALLTSEGTHTRLGCKHCGARRFWRPTLNSAETGPTEAGLAIPELNKAKNGRLCKNRGQTECPSLFRRLSLSSHPTPMLSPFFSFFLGKISANVSDYKL